MNLLHPQSITHAKARPYLCPIILCLAIAGGAGADMGSRSEDPSRAQFIMAWEAARKGDHTTFNRLGGGLQDYELYPYWQYEDYRHRRAQVPVEEMAAFLVSYERWAFSSGLKEAWLKTLGERGRWEAMLAHGSTATDSEIQCYHARAMLESGHSDGLLQEAQRLWTAERSQPKPCDPVFSWLGTNDGITRDLAWERIRLAMLAGNPGFTLYLKRFVPANERVWVDRWHELNRTRYRNLGRASAWGDTDLTRMITSISLRHLASHDAVRAMDAFQRLDGHFDWGDETRGDILREIALQAGVSLDEDGLFYMERVPMEHRNEQLLQWWVRLALARQDWAQVRNAIDQMEPESSNDARWRYWSARSRLELADVDAGHDALRELALEANFYGFLAADHLLEPYSICPQEPDVDAGAVNRLRGQTDFSRALELREAGLDNWAQSEWSLAARRLNAGDLKVAAALALSVGWYDRAIFALGDSGELRLYKWRFPVLWEQAVMEEAGHNDLDPPWVLGVIRSESAMTENAKSPAGALGLMQVTPVTARKISKKHGLVYRGQDQLLEGAENIRFGTVYLRELLEQFDQNPVLVSGAYNAGPNAVSSWLKDRPRGEAALWIETIPYYETRDYITRVLAFTTIYDWLLLNPVRRVSSRMPAIDSGNMLTSETAEVVCRMPG